MIKLPQLPRRLQKKIRAFFYAIIVGCITEYVYDHSLKPLQAAPVPSTVEVSRSVGGELGPPTHQQIEPTPAPAPVPPPSKGSDWPKEPVIFPDKTHADVYAPTCTISGRKVEFRVVVFSDVYSWVFGETDRVKINGRVLDEGKFRDRLQSPALQKIMADPSKVIVVGTASCEGSEDSEEERAADRAWTLKQWVEEERPWGKGNSEKQTGIPHALSLGHWRDERDSHCKGSSSDSEETWYQRRVILMAVRMKDGPPLANADFQSCVKQGLKDDPELEKLDQLLNHYSRYSRFELDKKWTGEDIP